MKEATGELTGTVIVLLIIGGLMAFFYYTFWPMIKSNFDATSQCSKAICENCPTGDCEYVTCHMKNSDEEFQCVYKG